MSRTAERRTSRRLESTAEDAAVLFTALLASPVPLLPGAVAAAISNGGADDGGSGSGGGSSGSGGGGSVGIDGISAGIDGGSIGQNEDGADQRHGKSTGSAETTAAAAIAGLDWLAGVFRLGLACEKAAPGEAASALASAPEATSAALADFLAATTAAAAAAMPATRSMRRLRRAEAGTRWLACRLMACGGDGARSPWPWPALRRDCALQVRNARACVSGAVFDFAPVEEFCVVQSIVVPLSLTPRTVTCVVWSSVCCSALACFLLGAVYFVGGNCLLRWG